MSLHIINSRYRYQRVHKLVKEDVDVFTDSCKKCKMVLCIGVIFLIVLRFMNFYGYEGVAVYTGFVAVERYWYAFAAAIAIMVISMFVRTSGRIICLILQEVSLISMLACDFICIHASGFTAQTVSIYAGFVIYIIVTLIFMVFCGLASMRNRTGL